MFVYIWLNYIALVNLLCAKLLKQTFFGAFLATSLKALAVDRDNQA